MLIALPAIADGPTVPSDPTYYQPGREVVDGCGAEILGENLNATEVTMVPQYAPICGAGKYSDISSDPNGVCTDCSGRGKYCPGITAEEVEANLDSVTGLPKGNLGIIDCPVGYTDVMADVTATTISACKKIITSDTCDAVADNFRNGTMTVDPDITLPLPLDYRDVDSHCYGSLECDAGYAKKNVYEWIKENPEAVSSVTSCSLGGFKNYTSTWSQQTGTVYSYTPCDADMEPGMFRINLDTNNSLRPMNTFNYIATCSNEAGNFIAADSAAYANVTGTSTGTRCYVKNIDVPDQPWIYMDYFEAAIENGVQMTAAERCQKYCGLWNIGNNYPLVVKDDHTGTKPIVKDSNNNYYAKDGSQFIPQTEIASGTCYSYDNGVYRTYPDLTTSAACTNANHNWYTNNESIYFDTQNAEPVGNIGLYKYVAYKYITRLLNQLIEETEEDENVQVCGGRTVNIDWVGVEESGAAATCTYKSDMAVPTAEQTPQHEGYTFVGWTVGPVAAPSNDSSENNGSESENNGG